MLLFGGKRAPKETFGVKWLPYRVFISRRQRKQVEYVDWLQEVKYGMCGGRCTLWDFPARLIESIEAGGNSGEQFLLPLFFLKEK